MPASTRPNILWIFSDQHSAHAMGCAGDPNVDTPNLDRLAREGVHFTNAYSNAPLCSPFRACLYRGQYIATHGVTSLFRPLLPTQPTMPEVLQSHGYHTSHMGKWHLSGGDGPCHFVSPYFRPGWDDWLGWENSNRFMATTYGVGDNPFPYLVLERYQTDALTDLTVDWLAQRRTGQPWFHVMSFEPPHSPNIAPEPYMRMFRDQPLTYRPNFVSAEHPQRERFEQELRGYYAQIKNLDDNVGRILQALEQTGQLDHTIICYFSDHGDMMGSHGRRQKSRPEEESAGIPLLVRCPGLIPSGVISDALISAVDLMPTLLSLVNIPIPDSVEGEDLSSLLNGQRADGKDVVLIEYESPYWPEAPQMAFRALRSGPWLYSFFLTQGPTQLFNLDDDPFELSNLIDSPDHGAVRQELQTKLADKLRSIGDDFLDRARQHEVTA